MTKLPKNNITKTQIELSLSSSNHLGFKTPRTLRKLYLQDQISKLDYVKGVFNFKDKIFPKVLFIFFVLLFTFLLFPTDFNLESKIASIIWISLFMCWLAKLKLTNVYTYVLLILFKKRICKMKLLT